MAAKIEDEFLCPICLEVAEDAVETECCNHAYCEEHATTIAAGGGACPTCRKTPFRYRPAIIVRRLIGNLPAECPFCKSTTIQRGNLEDHKKSCAKRPSTYRAPQTQAQPAPRVAPAPSPVLAQVPVYASFYSLRRLVTLILLRISTYVRNAFRFIRAPRPVLPPRPQPAAQPQQPALSNHDVGFVLQTLTRANVAPAPQLPAPRTQPAPAPVRQMAPHPPPTLSNPAEEAKFLLTIFNRANH